MFPERLKELRLNAGLTQKELASAINTSQQNIGFYELGKRNPKREILNNLSNFFHVSIDYLLGNTDIKNSDTLSDQDLLDLLNTGSASYDGKPLTKKDQETLLQVLKDYFDGTLKGYD